MTATVTNTGKVSQLNITVQKAAYANSLALDESVFYTCMEVGATSKFDLGDDAGGLSVKDQYDRDINMLSDKKYTNGLDTDKNAVHYKVLISSSDIVMPIADASVFATAVDTATVYADPLTLTTAKAAYAGVLKGGKAQLQLAAIAKGNATVRFTLFNDVNNDDKYVATDDGKEVDSRSINIAVVTPDQVTDYTADAPTTPLYVVGTKTQLGLNTSGVNDQLAAWNGEIDVFGKTSSGSKVKLNEYVLTKTATPTQLTTDGSATTSTAAYGLVDGAFVSNGDEFIMQDPGKQNDVYVSATALNDKSKTTASTTVTINVNHEQKVHAVTANVTSSTELPKIKSAILSIRSGLWDSMDVNDETISIPSAKLITCGFVAGNYLVRFDESGNELDFSTAGTGRAAAYFRAVDQYGKKCSNFSQIKLAKATGTGLSVTSAGKLVGTPSTGEYTFSAITNNGLVKTFKLIVQ